MYMCVLFFCYVIVVAPAINFLIFFIQLSIASIFRSNAILWNKQVCIIFFAVSYKFSLYFLKQQYSDNYKIWTVL